MSKMFNYEADHIHDMVHPDLLTDTSHYVAECKEIILNEVTPNYPKLTEYEKEWLYFSEHVYQDGHPVNLEYQTVDIDGYASVENAIPFYYKEASLKGNTKYRDIDTGDILDTFDETKNLELVSVQMPVLKTVGKNLFDMRHVGEELSKINPIIIENNTLIIESSGFYHYCYKYRPINFKSNTQYTLSANIESNSSSIGTVMGFHYTDGSFFYINKAQPILTSDANKTIDYITFSYGNPWIEETWSNIQLEEGSSATTYEPYKPNILTINEPVELRGIGDVKDELDLLTGEYVQRIGEVVLDGVTGLQDWRLDGTNETTGISGFYLANSINSYNFSIEKNQCVISNEFKTVPLTEWKNRKEEACIDNTGNIAFLISSSKLSEISSDGFKQYLSQNPITIQYKLAKTSIKTVDLNTIIKPYEGTNHYTLSSDTILPHLHLSVPVESTGAQTLMEITQEE